MTKPGKVTNPALKELEIFVGNWDMEISGAAFLPDPQTKVHAPTYFKWIEDGGFLVMHQGEEGVPQATWLIGRDETTEFFKVFYFDERMVSRIYEMSFKNGEWIVELRPDDLASDFYVTRSPTYFGEGYTKIDNTDYATVGSTTGTINSLTHQMSKINSTIEHVSNLTFNGTSFYVR